MLVADTPPADADEPHDIEKIADTEKIYRRIPVSCGWVNETTRQVDPQAFAPNKNRDATGLSVVWAAYSTPEEAAKGPSQKGYYVAALEVGAVRAAGIAVEHRPNTPNGYAPAHAELPDLKAENRKDAITDNRQNALAQLVNTNPHENVFGPFLPTASP